MADLDWKIVGVADFNKDGRPDLLWQHTTGPLALWAMDGTKVMFGGALPGAPDMLNTSWRVAAIADMNADGNVDVIWRHNDGWLAVWMMDGVKLWAVYSLNPPAEFNPSWRIVGAV